MIDGHGDDAYKYGQKIRINFSSNVYNHVNHNGLREHLYHRMESIRSYPEPEPYSLEQALAHSLHLSDGKEVCVTNGATEAIYLIAQTFRGKNSAILMPTFSEYADACRLHHHKIQVIYALDMIPSGTNLIWICNPNNPTGVLMDQCLLMEILKRCRELDIFLVVDECFLDFVEEPALYTLKKVLGDYRNLFIIKAFTKRYAMPGLRLGYGLCANTRLLEKMTEENQPWNISTPAQAAGMAALLENSYVEAGRQLVFKEKAYLRERLTRLGLKVYPSMANYLFFKGPEDLFQACLQKKVLIRDCSNYPGLSKGYYRIAVKKHVQNEILVKALEEIWQKRL